MKYLDKIKEYMEVNTCFAELNETSFIFICGTEYPSNSTYKAIVKAWTDEKQRQIQAMYKAHPRWLRACQNGASAEACFRIWKEEEGLTY